MLLLLALLLLIFLPSPWNVVGVVASGILGILEVGYWHRRMRERKVQTGIENLVGATGEVTEPCEPIGQIRVLGELWQARSSAGLPRGTQARVVALNGLMLDIEAADDPPATSRTDARSLP